MANNSKVKTSKIRVSVGSNANIFHDQVTGITVIKGDITELTTAQFRNKRIQTAIASGHLILVPESIKAVEKYSEVDIDNLSKKVQALYDQGTTVEKIAGTVTLEEVQLIAKANDVIIEKGDTIEDILREILEN